MKRETLYCTAYHIINKRDGYVWGKRRGGIYVVPLFKVPFDKVRIGDWVWIDDKTRDLVMIFDHEEP